MIPEKISKMCDNRFATHKATLVQNTDLYLIIDWRRKCRFRYGHAKE